MKLLHVRECGRVEIFDAADRRAFVRMHGEGVFVDVVPKESVGLSKNARAEFLLDHFALRFEVRFVDVERAHSIRFRPQQGLQVIRGQLFVVKGRVVPRLRVVVPANVFC